MPLITQVFSSEYYEWDTVGASANPTKISMLQQFPSNTVVMNKNNMLVHMRGILKNDKEAAWVIIDEGPLNATSLPGLGGFGSKGISAYWNVYTAIEQTAPPKRPGHSVELFFPKWDPPFGVLGVAVRMLSVITINPDEAIDEDLAEFDERSVSTVSE